MIAGIGVDLTTISRVERACAKESFLERVFSPEEIERYRGDGARLAANFAAKEAFAKAMGTGVRGFSLPEVCLFRDDLGKPFYRFSGRALALVEEQGLTAHASVSDEGDQVIVFAVLEKE